MSRDMDLESDLLNDPEIDDDMRQAWAYISEFGDPLDTFLESEHDRVDSILREARVLHPATYPHGVVH